MKKLSQKIDDLDEDLIRFARFNFLVMARVSIFVVYFWFGLLKVFSASPANPLVSELLSHVLPFMAFSDFIFVFGIFEMIIGIIFVIPRLERPAIFLLILHLATTVMPLFILPQVAWQGFLVPTLEGQYIIKNILLISLAMGLGAHLHFLRKHRE